LGYYEVPKRGMESLVLVGADENESILELFCSRAWLNEEAHAISDAQALKGPDLRFLGSRGSLGREG
jgi:hypothetical protein